MLKLQRQCATIQVTVWNDNSVMVFDESVSAEATGYLEHVLKNALTHEARIVEGKIANEFHDRIAKLNKRIRELEGKERAPRIVDKNIVDAEFSEVNTIRLPPPSESYDA